MAKRKKARKQFPRIIFILILILVVSTGLYASFRALQYFLTNAEYFVIKELEVKGISDEYYIKLIEEDVLGSNIFLLDARKLSKKIKHRFLRLDSVHVTRVLPAKILVAANERTAVAALSRDTLYLLDVSGMILTKFPAPGLIDVPIIIGLENKIKSLEVGTVYKTASLKKALKLAQVLKSYLESIRQSLPADRLWRVVRIDATQMNALSFWFNDEMQVIVGEQAFQEKISLLPAILKTTHSEIAQILYIDLRPKEPVIAYKK